MSDKSGEVREWVLGSIDLQRAVFGPSYGSSETIPVIEKSAYDKLKAENAALIEAHDAQVKIAKDFQKLFREVEPEMSRLTQENERLHDSKKEWEEKYGDLRNTSGYELGRRGIELTEDKLHEVMKERDHLRQLLKSVKAALAYAYEDHGDQYYLNVLETINKELGE